MFIPRHFDSYLQKLLKQFPIACLLGPRQCGKTTFVKKYLADWKYFDLDKPSHIAQIRDDPEALLNRYKKQVIFDEAQQLPELFPVIRSFVDEHPSKGNFILLGSASPSLIKNVSESLAGRVGFLDISPFHLEEVDHETNLWLKGGYPGAYLAKNSEQRLNWLEAYTRTFIERDLNLYGIDIQPTTMRRLWAMLAHVHGGLLNASELGNSLGITYHTVNRYIDILEQTFLVRRLRPFFANVSKRLVKSPKIYIRDAGLLHYFLNIHSDEELATHPKRGSSWEGFVIEQLIEDISLSHPGSEWFFWKTATGQEVDLLLKINNSLIPIEIKLHSSPKRSDLKGLLTFLKDLNLKRGYVIHPEGETYSLGDGIEVTTIKKFLENI